MFILDVFFAFLRLLEAFSAFKANIDFTIALNHVIIGLLNEIITL